MSIVRYRVLVSRSKCCRFLNSCTYSTQVSSHKQSEEDEFRVLELFPKAKESKKAAPRLFNTHVQAPRTERMKTNQDWPSVWPAPRTFHPAVVPLPVYQGYNQKGAPPNKFANPELMKIPNFLHLTPLAIKRHCEAIKKFCTEFPAALKTDADCHKHFPVTVITTDYCHASPSIRDERSRIVVLKVKVSALNLDYHGRDKLLRLVGPDRYDKRSDILTLTADRCPLRKQNYDYLTYLLTALHHESMVTEPWEHEKTEADMEKFFFEGSRIEKHACETVAKVKSKPLPIEEIKNSEEVTEFGEKVADLINLGENEKTMTDYRTAVLKLLNIKSENQHATH